MPAARRLRFLAPILLIYLVAACTEFGAASPAASSGVTLPPEPTEGAGLGVATSSPEPGASATAEPSAGPTGVPEPTPTAAPTVRTTTGPTGETMVVRAYFLMADQSGDPKLVPVLRTVQRSAAVVEAALQALVAGPSTKERNADPPLTSAVPSDTEVLGVRIDGDLATVDLSAAFASGGGSSSMFGRLAQVVYTVTQLGEVDRVSFEIDGEPVGTFSSEGIVLDQPVTRATYADDWLPAIFVDRPAWGASLGSRVSGSADVFEAVFRLAVLDRNGATLLERQVTATCGTGCHGTFSVPVAYDVSRAQWGTLRVWDLSARDGRPVDVREYPVWLTP